MQWWPCNSFILFLVISPGFSGWLTFLSHVKKFQRLRGIYRGNHDFISERIEESLHRFLSRDEMWDFFPLSHDFIIKMLHWAGIRSQWFSRFFPLSEIRVPVHFPSFGHDFSWRNYVHLIFPTQIFRWQIGRQSENLLPQINAEKWKSSHSESSQHNSENINSVLIFHSHHQNGNKWLSTFFPRIYGSISHWSLHLKSC